MGEGWHRPWEVGGDGQGGRTQKIPLARVDERPAGTAFVGANDAIFMVHTIEVLPAFHRRGVARVLIQAAARFAARNRADLLFLVVLASNVPAIALYEALGMQMAGRYHYRLRDKP